MVGAAVASVVAAGYLLTSGLIGSEFLPHLDEGAIWVRGTLAPSTGPSEGIRLANQARVLLATFPEVTVTTSQVGRPDDGTDTTGFFNTEYFVDLKPKEQWRPVFHQNKEELIAAMNEQLSKIPGVIWNFSQPIADNMEEAVSGVKGELAIKVYGDDLKLLEDRGDQIVNVMRRIQGIQDLGLFRVIGQPNLNLVVDRQKAARYQINVADVQDAIQTAVGGNAVSQVLQGEQRYDLVIRYLPGYRDTQEAIEGIRLLAPSGERVSLAQLCSVQTMDGASEIYREGNSRYVAIKYSVRGRDLGSTVEEAIRKVGQQVKLPPGYRIDWAGEYASQKRSQQRLMIVLPITILVIFIILYTMFHSFKWATMMLANIAMAPLGRPARAADHRDALQRLFGRGLSGAIRSVRANRGDHAGVHQPASRAGPRCRRCRCGRRRPAVAAHHDDHAGGDARSVAGGALARDRLRFSAALRDCHRGRADGGDGDEYLPAAHLVCVDRP